MHNLRKKKSRSIYFVNFFSIKNLPRNLQFAIFFDRVVELYCYRFSTKKGERVFTRGVPTNLFSFETFDRNASFSFLLPCDAHATVVDTRDREIARSSRDMIDDNCTVFTVKAMRPVRYYVSIFPPDECARGIRVANPSHASRLRYSTIWWSGGREISTSSGLVNRQCASRAPLMNSLWNNYCGDQGYFS